VDPFQLVARSAEEVVTEDELRLLLRRPDRRAYIGFEPSGAAHVGYVILANKVRDLQDAGFHVSIFLADWHAYINDKFGGDLEAIRACGKYMEDMFLALGVRPGVHYKYASECVADPKYWETVLKVGKASTLSRVKRAMSIMGRKEEDAEQDYAKTIYPVMQVADIFYNEWHLAYGGMDQRHAHMLARDVADKLGWWKPVALHTPLLPSLLGPGEGRMDPAEAKMSKSRPGSGIFLHDTPEQVEQKLRGAWCPPKQVDGNPVLLLARLVLFQEPTTLAIERPAKFGGPLAARSYAELEQAYTEGLHPLDLKKAVAKAMNARLEAVRTYFEKHPQSLARMRALTQQ
jgi:tyrosyl-tRNA synthetase